MRGKRSLVASSMIALVLVSGTVEPASAGRKWHGHPDFRPEATLKLGMYDPAEGTGSGLFGGIEVAAGPSPHFRIGVTGDYFYRGTSSRTDGFIEADQPYDIPVETSYSEHLSSTHLGMLGLIGRLRIPTGGPVPFVSAGVLGQVLHLRARDDPDSEEGRHHSRRTRSDTFAGIGWQVGGGVEQPLDDRVSLSGELGYLFAEPIKREYVDGRHVTLRALASGVFARAGVSVRY